MLTFCKTRAFRPLLPPFDKFPAATLLLVTATCFLEPAHLSAMRIMDCLSLILWQDIDGLESLVKNLRLVKAKAFAVAVMAFDAVYTEGTFMLTDVQAGSASCCNCSSESLHTQPYPQASHYFHLPAWHYSPPVSHFTHADSPSHSHHLSHSHTPSAPSQYYPHDCTSYSQSHSHTPHLRPWTEASADINSPLFSSTTIICVRSKG